MGCVGIEPAKHLFESFNAIHYTTHKEYMTLLSASTSANTALVQATPALLADATKRPYPYTTWPLLFGLSPFKISRKTHHEKNRLYGTLQIVVTDLIKV